MNRRVSAADRLVDQRREPVEPRVDLAQVHAQRASAALRERGEVALRLRGDQRGERLVPARDREVAARVGGDLDEQA